MASKGKKKAEGNKGARPEQAFDELVTVDVDGRMRTSFDIDKVDEKPPADVAAARQESDKVITFVIPCYNSFDYMDRCIQSILSGIYRSTDIEIVIVDDGSTDATGERADEWASGFPGLIKVVHQENGGHGMAVLAGLDAASGTFLKVVDSDDWLSPVPLSKLLEKIRETEAKGEHIDLFITNYVYEHGDTGKEQAIRYKHVLPRDRTFGWDEIGRFPPTQNLLMHSLCYRTSVLRDGGVPMPAHTFYVDNIYAWVPLPRCKRIYYMDVNLYRYLIGRVDQSVNESVMAGRIDQQRRITRIMMEAYHPWEDIKVRQLRRYMVNYFVIMMTICTIFSHLSEQPDAMDELDVLWADLKRYDERLWRKCRYGMMGVLTNLPTKGGNKVALGGYRIARKVVSFN